MRSGCCTWKCRLQRRKSGAPCMPANADRGLAYATTLSLALHALVLALTAPGLKQLLTQPFATPAAMVARMVQQAAVPELAASATSTPAAAKRQAPKRVAPIAAIATTEPAPPQAATDSISVAQYRQQLI